MNNKDGNYETERNIPPYSEDGYEAERTFGSDVERGCEAERIFPPDSEHPEDRHAFSKSTQSHHRYGGEYKAVDTTSPNTERRRPRKVNLLGLGLAVFIGMVAVVPSLLNGMTVSHSEPARPESAVSDVAEAEAERAGEGERNEVWSEFAEDFGDSYAGNSIQTMEPTGEMTLEYMDIPSGGELSLQELYEYCLPYVVSVTADIDAYSYSWGSGVVMSADGYVITNTHVLEDSSSVIITLYDGTSYDAKLVGADEISDIAVLKIEAEGLDYATFASPDSVVVGDGVVAIGNPLSEELVGTMTNGIVSAINRDINLDNVTMNLIQTNTAINEGNSGGPLINMYGQVVGITNMKMMGENAFSTIEGIGFAIPTSTLKQVVDSLIRDGRVTGRPAIGITVGAFYGDDILPAGLYISEVSISSDAEAKGVMIGDILTHVNGIPMQTVDDLSAILDVSTVGSVLLFDIYRDDGTVQIEVELMEMSDVY